MSADSHPTITIPGETFSVNGELMNLELTDGGAVITVAAIAGKYGRVFLTYNMATNPNSKPKALSRAVVWVSTIRETENSL